MYVSLTFIQYELTHLFSHVCTHSKLWVELGCEKHAANNWWDFFGPFTLVMTLTENRPSVDCQFAPTFTPTCKTRTNIRSSQSAVFYNTGLSVTNRH
jgi:hypothetical protein